MTLMEVMIASLAAVVVVGGAGALLGTSGRMERGLRVAQGGPTSELGLASLASVALAKHLERADRVLLSPAPPGPATRVKVRIPPEDPALVDTAAAYTWFEYYLVAGNNLFRARDGDCGGARLLSGEISGLTFQYLDTAADPPGGPVFAWGPGDNNIVEYTVSWTDGTLSQTFNGAAMLRANAYTDDNADAGDSGTGLSLNAPDYTWPDC